VAGKTGTAHKVDPKTRRYSKRLYSASFVGFVPADDPALVITVVVNVERDWHGQAYSGGRVAAPIFARVAQQSLPLVGVFPSAGKGRRRQAAVEPASVGAGPAEDRTEHPGPVVNGVGVPEGVDDLATLVPSYLGKSLREALALSSQHGHHVKAHGNGWVEAQWPGPGTVAGEALTVHIHLSGRN
jgi:cell division protein FtsI (penicillin-binding protein 3)